MRNKLIKSDKHFCSASAMHLMRILRYFELQFLVKFLFGF